MECPNCCSVWSSDFYIPRILNCGHSVCEKCCYSTFEKSSLVCPVCKAVHSFNLDRNFNDTDQVYTQKCVETMSKNFTLLSLISSRPTLSPGQKPSYQWDLSLDQMCPEHDLPIHSYTEKPYSLLCDVCLEEISGFKLVVKPIPEVVTFLREKLDDTAKSLNDKKHELQQAMRVLNHSAKEEALQQMGNYFKNMKLELQNFYKQSKENLKELIAKQETKAQKYTETVQQLKDKLKASDKQCSEFESIPDYQVVSYTNEVNQLLEEVSVPFLLEEPQQLSIQVNPACYEQLKEMITNSVEISLDEETPEKTWTCLKCNYKTLEGQIQCTQCTAFRPLESYPNLIDNPQNATQTEIEELNLRRELELEEIKRLDEHYLTSNWYIVNAEWINQWKSFIFNEKNTSELGKLPPGPISNNLLFKDPSNPSELKPKLKPAVHYRGVNYKVWKAYLKTYGGGPQIVRKKLNIYDEPV